MPQLTERVEAAYLAQPPPRPFPGDALAAILSDEAARLPRTLLDPLLIAAICTLALLAAFGIHWLLWVIPLALVVSRLWRALGALWRRVMDEVQLLRHGVALEAQVLRLIPHRDMQGEIDGALLACRIVVAPRRSYLGTVWLSDGGEAMQLMRTGHVAVFCLPHAPGTWRISAPLRSEIRHDRGALLRSEGLVEHEVERI